MSALRVLAVAAALLPGACVTPPIVREGGRRELSPEAFSASAERVEIEVEPGVFLRGVFLPAAPAAPVEVVFLGAGASVTSNTAGTRTIDILRDLARHGIAGLCVDYRGVGPSDGDCSPWNLRGDARAAYAFAVDLAGGESRVVVRGISIGTLAAASLLEDGATPAAVVLAAPVRAETVAVNYVAEEGSAFLAFFAGLALRRAGDVDLVVALAECRVPLVVAAPETDFLLPADEAVLVETAVRTAGGTWAVQRGCDHYRAALAAYSVLPEEAALYERLFR